jgi:predicted ATPase
VKFVVVQPSRYVPKRPAGTWLLVQDNWNDFGFTTQYHLYRSTGEDSERIGAVKVLRRGQTTADGIQIQTDFDALSDEYVSVGESLDYYTRLAELAPAEKSDILKSLRDVAMRPELERSFAAEEGWGVSLFRGQQVTDIPDYLRLARSLVTTDYTELPGQEAQFSFHVSGWKQPVQFDFSRPRAGEGLSDPFMLIPSPLDSDLDPLGRLIVLIGRNGSGKSTLLFRLARVAFASAASRADGVFNEFGTLSPSGLGFPRIIAVSYSAFDSFALPGLPPREKDQPDEREQIVSDARRGEGRYLFIGLRDIASELEERISVEPGPVLDPVVKDDRVPKTYLKSIDSLAAEFRKTLDQVRRNDRQTSFQTALDLLTKDPSFSEWDDGAALYAYLSIGGEEAFLRWSTGQKIAVQILASLAAHVVPMSMVLLDEPEMHLHPPLLATLMHAVRHLLHLHKGFGVVATHSPVVLQESLSRHVRIIRREGDITEVFATSIETFGENVGTLTAEVFGLHSEATDFYRILDSIIDNQKALDKVESYFKPFGLSSQARAYVMTRLAKLRGN